VQHRVEPPSPRLLGQNVNHLRISVAGMDDQRQARLTRGGDVGSEHPALNIARAAVVVIVQTRFADRDAARVDCQRNYLCSRNVRLFRRVVRMRTHRAEDPIMLFGYASIALEPANMG
jgi:hypothetical protein